MIVYIAGPMKGKRGNNRRAFNRGEKLLKNFTSVTMVLNPAKLPQGLEESKYLPICLAMIDASDAIIMLKGWEKSDGARAEYYYAKRQGKTILEWHAVDNKIYLMKM